ncbi:hypothetical protein [Rhizobium sp. SYY.PMSO]|uniref:hypothetical protein n=1 Tax=Rhizobium sp. SYY.PMSO TaxID=3382192 RepID=UPI0013B04283
MLARYASGKLPGPKVAENPGERIIDALRSMIISIYDVSHGIPVPQNREPGHMRRYYGVSLAISVITLLVWMVYWMSYHAPTAADGNGPDGFGLLLLLAFCLVMLLLAHSAILALVVRKHRAATIFGGRWGLPIHLGLAVLGVLWLMFGVGMLAE